MTMQMSKLSRSSQVQVFPFRFERAARYILLVLGVTPRTSGVVIADGGVSIRQPVGVLTPRWLLAHPALTVTVDQPGELVRRRRPGRLRQLGWLRQLGPARLAGGAAARVAGRSR